MRLIEKVKEPLPHYGTKNIQFDLPKIIDKLGQLEDIEEELGIDLLILPRLLKIKPKDIIYVKQHSIIVECKVTDNALIDGCLIVFSHYHIGHTVYTPVCHYYDYGKTWALTKEELK